MFTMDNDRTDCADDGDFVLHKINKYSKEEKKKVKL